MLEQHAQETLERRQRLGNEILALAWRDPFTNDEDRELAAKDAISDVLTAVFGPAGTTIFPELPGTGQTVVDDKAKNDAAALLLAALDSYLGDAEDYVEVVEEKSPAVQAIEKLIRHEEASRVRAILFVAWDREIDREGSFSAGTPYVDFDPYTKSDDEVLEFADSDIGIAASQAVFEGGDYLKSEDYETLDNLEGSIDGLQLALKAVIEAEQA